MFQSTTAKLEKNLTQSFYNLTEQLSQFENRYFKINGIFQIIKIKNNHKFYNNEYKKSFTKIRLQLLTLKYLLFDFK